MRICLSAALALAFASPLLAQSPAAPAAPKPAEALPVESFAQLPFIQEAEISPNGQRMAGLMNVGGERVISIINLFSRAEAPTRLRVPDGTEAYQIRWVNDDNIIVSLVALRPVETDRWYLSRLLGVNRATGAVTKLLWDLGGQNAADVMWVPNDGSDEILVAAQGSIYPSEPDFWPTVYRVSVASGKRKIALKPRADVLDWAADSSGKVRVGFGYVDASRSSRLLYRSEADDSFKVVDRANARKNEALTSPFLFLPGGDRALIMRDSEKGRTSVYEIDLKTLETARTIFEPVAGDVERVILSADRTSLLGLRLSSQDTTHWIDPALAELQAQFAKAVPNANVDIESMSSDRSKMLVRVSAADMPGTLYFYDVNVGKLQIVASINEKLKGRRLSPVKMIQYKARDGLQIEGVLTLPAGRDPKNLPFIMMPHGGPWAQDTLSYDYWAQFLASRGYAVLQPNFRGSTGYGTDFVEKGKGQLGFAMQDDLTDGLRWAVAQGIADPKRTCIVGASYGGYAAMWGVAKDPDQYRCSISISGVSSLRREVNDFGDSLRGGLFTDQWKAMTPDFPAVSPINAIARIKAPMLLIHGKKDVTVDHSQSTQMFSAMKKANKDVEFVSLPEADHYFTRQADRLTLLSSMETFLKKHNPAD